jgi:hypothetical protein
MHLIGAEDIDDGEDYPYNEVAAAWGAEKSRRRKSRGGGVRKERKDKGLKKKPLTVPMYPCAVAPFLEGTSSASDSSSNSDGGSDGGSSSSDSSGSSSSSNSSGSSSSSTSSGSSSS